MEPSYREFLYEHETAGQLAYYSAIGRVIVNWSMLEDQFDICMWTLYDALDGKTLVKRPPGPMKHRLAFWTRCFEELPALASKREAALRFATRMNEAAGDRNMMLHTNWGAVMDKETPPEIVGSGFKTDATGYRHYTTRMSLDRLHGLLVETGNLQTMLFPITFHLTEMANRH